MIVTWVVDIIRSCKTQKVTLLLDSVYYGIYLVYAHSSYFVAKDRTIALFLSLLLPVLWYFDFKALAMVNGYAGGSNNFVHMACVLVGALDYAGRGGSNGWT